LSMSTSSKNFMLARKNHAGFQLAYSQTNVNETNGTQHPAFPKLFPCQHPPRPFKGTRLRDGPDADK
jgi:hypothetical protein